MKLQNENETIKFQIPKIYILLVITLIVITAIIIGLLSGLIQVTDILLNFIGFISMLIAITMLAIVGAIFLGMYISHRILTKKGFTPFEISMLEMHEDVKEIKKRLAKLENIQNKKNNTKK